MSNFIPKHQSGAYQPWKLTSLEGAPVKKTQDDPQAAAEQRAKEDAEQMKALGVTPEQARSDFVKLQAEILDQIAAKS